MKVDMGSGEREELRNFQSNPIAEAQNCPLSDKFIDISTLNYLLAFKLSTSKKLTFTKVSSLKMVFKEFNFTKCVKTFCDRF